MSPSHHVSIGLDLHCNQLLEAAKDGRANEIIELLDEGADIKVKDEVRVACLYCFCLAMFRT